MWRFELSKKNYEELKLLIKERDRNTARAKIYESIIGEYPPPYAGQIHHVEWRSHGGGDREDNLILLSIPMHDRIHNAARRERKELNAKFVAYLECEEVRAWRAQHREELEKLYKTAEEARRRKKRNGCIPKKPDWQPF